MTTSSNIKGHGTKYLCQSIPFMLAYTSTKFHNYSLNHLAYREGADIGAPDTLILIGLNNLKWSLVVLYFTWVLSFEKLIVSYIVKLSNAIYMSSKLSTRFDWKNYIFRHQCKTYIHTLRTYRKKTVYVWKTVVQK